MAIHEVWTASEISMLSHPLGTWLADSHQVYKFVYDVEGDSIIESFTNGSFHAYKRMTHRTRYSQCYSFSDSISSLPPKVLPVQVIRRTQNYLYGEAHLTYDLLSQPFQK